MMRKKQIFRMLVGALAVCLTAACSNETEVLNGFPTDGNTISVSLRTNDIGAHTRTMIASADELSVENLSAYLFAEGEDGEYQLEKVYDNLTWNDEEEAHAVALTGIAERGPKKVYFVANGASIGTLPEGTTEPPLSEEDFQALLMSEMTVNPSTPLPMTAQAELAEWGKGVNNAIIEGPVLLKRVSARIDLKVDPQEESLIFVPTSIALSAAANSYIFPNEAVYEGEETVEISGTTLYPYETAAGTVEAVKVTGKVTVGETTKDVTFIVPFVDEDGSTIAIQRNHRYTVHITKINGFYSAEATVTVSDWSTDDVSGDLKAGEDLKMTATEETDGGELATSPAATAIYPDDESKSAVVELTAEDIKTYKIWVGSANIEAITTWSELLPQGWKMEEPASTRAEYLWEKSYWTLTIPANESPEAKSLTIKAVNRLELAKDEETEKYVQITFEQAGKEEEVVDHSKNPLLKWAEYNSIRTSGSGQQQTAPTSGFTNNLYGVGSYYQWGRNYGFMNYNEILTNGYFCNSTPGDVIFKGDGTSSQVNRYTSTDIIYTLTNLHYFLCSVKNGYNSTTNDWITNITNEQYWDDKWDDRTKSYTTSSLNSHPLPFDKSKNWRLPTKAEAEQLVPNNFNKEKLLKGILTELHEVNGVKVAMTWLVEEHNSRQCLVIKALVVPNNFNESKLTSIDWNNKDVVKRVFPGNGNIEVQYGKVDYYNAWGYPTGTRYFVRPLPYGDYGTNTSLAYPYIFLTKDCNDGRFGGFWTSESDSSTGDAYLFTYMLGGVNGNEYWIKVDTEDKDDAYSVRGVKTVIE